MANRISTSTWRGFVYAAAVAAIMLGAPRTASAGILVYQPPISSITGQRDLDDLDHHYVYTWRIPSIAVPAGQMVTAAWLFFSQISNWDGNDNRLYMHLLDTAKLDPSDSSILVRSALDVPLNVSPVPSADFNDDLAKVNGSYSAAGAALVANSTLNTNLGVATGVHGDSMHSFSTTPEDYKYTFSSSQVMDLRAYIASNGDVAIGLDPDCHFFNQGIYFYVQTGPSGAAVPEPASLTLLGLGVAGLFSRRRMRKDSVQPLA